MLLGGFHFLVAGMAFLDDGRDDNPGSEKDDESDGSKNHFHSYYLRYGLFLAYTLIIEPAYFMKMTTRLNQGYGFITTTLRDTREGAVIMAYKSQATGEAILGEDAKQYAGHEKWAGLMFGGIAGTIGRTKTKGRFLEMGAGPGFLAVMLAQRYPDIDFTLVDLSPDMADVAREQIKQKGTAIKYRYLVGDVADTAFMAEVGVYDCVYTTFSLHHWKDRETGLKNLWNVVAAGGALIIHDFRRINWLGALMGSGGLGKSVRSAFKPKELEDALHKVGADDIDVRTFPWSPFQTVIARKQ